MYQGSEELVVVSAGVDVDALPANRRVEHADQRLPHIPVE